MNQNFAKMSASAMVRLNVHITDTLKKVTGLNHIELEITVDRRQGAPGCGNEFLIVESQELVNYAYPKMFKSLKIANFGGQWTKECSPDFVGEHNIYWLPIKYRYEHFDCGTNGSDICVFWIDAEGNITDSRNELEKRK
jgi:hypothetical protein